MSSEFKTASRRATLSLCFLGSLSSLISLEDVRPAVLLLTLAPDSVFDETDRLLGMAVTILESVVVVVLLAAAVSFFSTSSKHHSHADNYT